MKKIYCPVLMCLLLSTGPAQANSYAPLADFPAVRNNALCQMTTIQESFLKSWTPSQNYFKIPAYPNAKLVSAFPSGTAKIGGKSYQTFPSAVLLSQDSPESIVRYYSEALGRGWHHIEDHGLMYIYRMPKPVESGEALTKLLMSRPGYTPHIAIDTELEPCDQYLVPQAITRITVVAAPQ